MQYPDTTTVYYVSQTALPLDAYAFYGLGRSLVIVVQSTQHRNCDQLVRLVRWRHRKHRQNRDLLLDPLMRSGMIEVLCIRHEKPAELLLMKNEKVIETFSPYASQIAFADGVRLWSPIRRSKDLNATCGRHSCKIRAKFPVIIPNQIFWCLPVRSRFSQLLRYPLIGRSARHIYMHDFPRFQFDDEEGKKRTEEEIRDLQKITGPHLCRMIAQECLPTLATGSFWAILLHILLNGSFTHPNIQLEELAPNALRPPESIVGGHLPDQRDCLV
jgi:hypothetical protein